MSELQRLPTNSGRSLAGRIEHREWIAGRAFTLLAHYWRDDDPEELTAAMGADWADLLEGIPQDVIQRACLEYQRREPRRKPTPGAVYAIAREMMPKPRPVPKPEPPEDTRTDEELAESAAKILKEAGFKLNAWGGVQEGVKD